MVLNLFWKYFVLHFLLVCSNDLFILANTANIPDEQRLLYELFESRNYDKRVRPVLNASESVQVAIGLTISKMDGIDAKHQKFTTSGWLSVTWYDERLQWNTSEYGGIGEVVVPPTDVWLPSFTLDNTASELVYVKDHFLLFRVTISSDGEMVWEPGGQFIAKCEVKIQYYPFDDQMCELIFSNWVFTGDVVNLTYSEDAEELFLETYSESGEWAILGTRITREDFYYDCCPNPYPVVHFKLHFQRKPLFYVMNIVVPSVMLCMLVMLVFRLPPDSGEKMGMGVTLLLSYSVLILMVSENVPPTSNGVPLIVIYLLVCMGNTSMTIVMSVMVLSLHHRGCNTRPPRWLRTLVYSFMAPFVREVEAQTRTTRNKSTSIPDSGSHETDTTDVSDASSYRDSQRDSNDKEQMGKMAREVIGYLEGITLKTQTAEENNEIMTEWKLIAKIVDRFLFCFFLILLSCLTTVILLVLPFLKPAVDWGA